MKTFIILAMFTSYAHAIDWEVSAGSTAFTKPDNSIWWQEPYENTFDLQSPSYTIGVTDKLRGLRWRAAYVRLGNVSSNAQATRYDSEYTGSGCSGSCEMGTFRTEGSIQGISFTVAPEKQFNSFTVFAEVGVFVYLPKFHATVAACGSCPIAGTIEYKNGWQAGPQIGVGIELGTTQLVLTAYRVDSPTPDTQAIPNWQGWAMNTALRQRF